VAAWLRRPARAADRNSLPEEPREHQKEEREEKKLEVPRRKGLIEIVCEKNASPRARKAQRLIRLPSKLVQASLNRTRRPGRGVTPREGAADQARKKQSLTLRHLAGREFGRVVDADAVLLGVHDKRTFPRRVDPILRRHVPLLLGR